MNVAFSRFTFRGNATTVATQISRLIDYAAKGVDKDPDLLANFSATLMNERICENLELVDGTQLPMGVTLKTAKRKDSPALNEEDEQVETSEVSSEP